MGDFDRATLPVIEAQYPFRRVLLSWFIAVYDNPIAILMELMIYLISRYILWRRDLSAGLFSSWGTGALRR